MRLTGLQMAEVTTDASPRGATTFALWEPPLTGLRGEGGAPLRRPATSESADLLADLVVADVRTLAFVRSRRAAESVALTTRARLQDLVVDVGAPAELPDKVAAYRAGYLAEDRRKLEKALRSGDLLGLATTNALELGVDVSGLDAVLIAGWPGTRASLWQQAGRAGRDGQDALAVLIARDDPLDTYLVHHPEALFGRPVEAIVLDPDNPYVLGPHLCAAASEIPLTHDDLEVFGPATKQVLSDLVEAGLLRERATGWFWTSRDRATDLADIRGGGGAPVQLVEMSTGRLLGTVDEPSAHMSVHTGAVYVHQGETFLVAELDLEAEVALLEAGTPEYTTFARDVTDISVIESLRSHPLGPGELHFGSVEVTSQVVSYIKRRAQSGELLGDEPLDLPPRTLRTRAVWWTLPASAITPLAGDGLDLGGAAHAAEHASIGLLPLFATCDRWDIGGVSTELHPDTGLLTVFVYDGHEGGAGFAERGYARARDWLTATREAIASCECERGCPSCIQSPKCGNGNEPLDKTGALRLLAVLLSIDPREA
jgi:DEAD/DEAH box helicase domain-containing protein